MAPPRPFVYLSPTEEGTGASTLLRAAFYGNLGRLKGAIKRLGIEKGKARDAVLALNKDGIGLLHAAACQGHLNVCKFLVEELGGDVNIAGAEGLTPFMAAVESDDVPTVEYFLDHGGDVTKTDDKRCTVLHHAAGIGCCKVTEFLLSKGVPVDIDCGLGTPIFHAAYNGKDKTLKILLDHQADPNVIVNNGACSLLMSSLVCRSLKCMKLLIKAGADVNGRGTLVSPLMFAASQGGYTNFIKFLLKAGANPNIPDDLGWLPVEHAALRDCREEVEMLFPVTSPILNVPEWSVNGIISHAKVDTKPMAIDHGPITVLYANRSICRLLMGDGDRALSDGNRCRMMQPNCAKACYRWGAGHMLLKEYKHVWDALLDEQKLDPGSIEIEKELREYGLQESKDVTVPAQVMDSKVGLYDKPTATYGDKPPNVSSVMEKTQVFVKHPHGTLSLQIDTGKDVVFLKEEVEQRMRLDVSGSFFMYQMSTLEAGIPLSSYGIEKDSNIYMCARLLGGQRFHGGRRIRDRRRFHSRRKFKTLSQFFQKHGEEFLREVKLPDGSTTTELTDLGCLVLSSLIHLFTSVFVAGKTWNGSIDLDSLIVVHGKVRIKKKPWKGLNSAKMTSDCTKLTSMIREMFIKNNVHPPYLKHLLGKLEVLAVDVFTVDQQLAFDYHISLIPSLNRVNLVYQIKRCYDGWGEKEKIFFRIVADSCSLPEYWRNTLMSDHLFRQVVIEGRKRNITYKSNGMSAFLLVRNYNTHAPEYSWIHVVVDSIHEDYQWFKCNSGVELMVPKYLGDFLAEAVFMFIEEKFDLTHVLRTCFALGSYVTASLSGSSSDDLSSESSSSSPSPRKRKRRNSVSHKKRKSRRCSSSSGCGMSDNQPRKRKRSHPAKEKSSKKMYSTAAVA